MNNLNSVLLEGRLVQDPKVTDFPQTKNSLCKLSLANNRYYKKDGEQVHEVSYFMVDVWGNTGENCAKYLKKGSGIRVVGRLKQERWKNEKEDNRQNIKVIAEHVDFFPSQKSKGQQKTKNSTDTASVEQEDALETEVINL